MFECQKNFHKTQSFCGLPTRTIPSSSSVSAPSSLPRLIEIDDEASEELESVSVSADPTELGKSSMDGGIGHATESRGAEAKSFSDEELEVAMPSSVFSETEERWEVVVSMSFSEAGTLGDISRRVSNIT